MDDRERLTEQFKLLIDNLPPEEVKSAQLDPRTAYWALTLTEHNPVIISPLGAYYVLREGSTWKSERLGGGVMRMSQFHEQSLIESEVFPADDED